MTGRLVAVVTQQLLDELTAVLMRPKFRRWVSVAAATVFVQRLAEEADLHPDPGAPGQRLHDPDDDYLVALAEQTGATIVTGDRDLLDAELDPPAIAPSRLAALLN